MDGYRELAAMSIVKAAGDSYSGSRGKSGVGFLDFYKTTGQPNTLHLRRLILPEVDDLE
jgi:hypothetical protein